MAGAVHGGNKVLISLLSLIMTKLWGATVYFSARCADEMRFACRCADVRGVDVVETVLKDAREVYHAQMQELEQGSGQGLVGKPWSAAPIERIPSQQARDSRGVEVQVGRRWAQAARPVQLVEG